MQVFSPSNDIRDIEISSPFAAASTRNIARIIQVLAAVTLLLTVILGYCLVKITGSLQILSGALVEVIQCTVIIHLIRKGNVSGAVFMTFLLHSLSTLYFGIILSSDARVQVMAIFLLGLAFLLFRGLRRWIAIGCIFAIIILIEANNRFAFFSKIDLLPAHETLIGYLIIGTVMFLTCLMYYIFTREISHYRKGVAQYTQQLQRTKTAISKYISKNSHQVGIDLNIIYGYLQHLLAQSATDSSTAVTEVQLRDLHAMLNATKSIQEFLNNSLAWSRIEQELEAPLKKETLDFELWLDGITERFKLMAKEKSVDLLLQTSGLPLYVVEDKYRLDIIVGNLLSNAIKYTAKNSVVLLRVSRREDHLVFEVIDQGPGITAERREKVFEPFASETGTGLGLTVARQLAHSLQGDVRIDPLFEIGAKFVFTVPLVMATYHQALAFKTSVNNTLDGLRVLLIDDDNASRRITFMNLQRLDYFIYTCATFEESKVRLQASTIDLILLDFGFTSDITAVDILRWLRKTNKTKRIPVIVLSAEVYSRVDGITDAETLSLQAGANSYMLKPIDFKTLATEIEKLIDPSRFKRYPWVK